MLRLKVFLLIIICSSALHAQNFRKSIKKADQYLNGNNYNKAITYYKKALKYKPGNADATYGLGLAYLFDFRNEEALKELTLVWQLNPDVGNNIEYYLGLAHQYDYNFDEAIRFYDLFGEKKNRNRYSADIQIAECLTADSLYSNPRPVVVENLGQTVNSPQHDFTPALMADGKTLYFTSNRAGSTGGLKLDDGSFYEDIYSTTLQEGQWNKPQKLDRNLNGNYHDAVASVSPNGKTLFVYSEKGNGDIYFSNFEDSTWTYPQALSSKINSTFWETSVSITADGQTLYFSSDRPGGYGGLDIYKSIKGEDGEWGSARNLGPTINTDASEDAPMIHPDGHTLYFSSSGHQGMGGYDIYYSKIEGQEFMEPVNLGYPINTVYDDNYFVISADLKHAYYASRKPGGLGMVDIYHVNMEEKVEVEVEEIVQSEPEPVLVENTELISENEEEVDEEMEEPETKAVITVFKGKVLDAKSGLPVGAVIKMVDNKNSTLTAEAFSDPQTGEFELVVTEGGDYGVSTSKKGYLFNSINFRLPDFSEYQEIDVSILLDEAEVGTKMVLKNIFFDTGSSDLRTESLGELKVIKDLLTNSPDLRVQINGHTDNVGNSVYNKLLSKKRAQSVVDYLIANGINSERLEAKGFGEEKPLVSNDDEIGGREINRRTEIEILGQSQNG
ncbi:cell envelope biogenesis protein OmpA [Marivirga tractuosa]|uniref:OmpA/MotB domain protein n=1 Tax=Marivirga tractuosa (strain ATCC 23168 / DSM 4126 / NBRC 15989 / NCIMB 1408 / VKM B-1430 / H-43) TaxID=643867 RepID=E4TSW2_MARTH|nr:OmpA family protein [Marivirga tractuosa]ADR22903.1 OmpA/MotB domain protein [Marivirga tractuosa DSM 4126]BDD16423.1 cell envelope biogenesis protein OmpA [Marivirga tractuosa]